MINLSINYQGIKVPIELNVTGAFQYDDVAALVANKLTENFSRYMNRKGTKLTEKSKQKYYLSQYCLMKLKLLEKL